ncbi:hypothetical protein RAJCM14343_1549 [Rhodococcus aetherivorans]|uniref:Uncharacterized protein n=1 Tax=Rhodococcus aetherivorans TaxID=191292 RepID=A0ABQ0YID5_9NOCA|nr:hypothetical protein RAJCM14343_1549 [Rhodococcus aetherivorans]
MDENAPERSSKVPPRQVMSLASDVLHGSGLHRHAGEYA